ncbi:helix-turn-helix domain-containing protein [Bacillus massiliigorillae]|uniref:helix-turn-helix domain-containing protein n=1 Tax=Bacillus massiliigorillae TaxID=1243664 RepID=UPI00039F7A71|nr:helix-turn-helix domain-containing protein [Bacillus massiliigorillae]
MNYLDLYLQKHNCKRYDVHKKTGVSQQLLSTHTNKKIEKYSNKVIIAIADTLGKTPGDVLNELLMLEKEKPIYEAYNPDELMVGLHAKYDQILIRGAYYKEVRKIMDSHLSENERLGVELGGAGAITLLIYAIDVVRDLFSNADKLDKEIDKKLNLYKVEKISDDSILLRLKQLDY